MDQEHPIDEGLSALAERLRDERADLTALKRDAVKQRVKRRAVRPATSPSLGKAPLLRSRLALTLVLVAGLMMTGTGATLAVTGIADDNDASLAQYGDQKPKSEEKLGSDPAETSRSFGDQTQVATKAGADSLPFTGFAVFPLLLGGIALAATGGVLRRRLDRQN